ncbi:M43 family zinc metalloprotease [Amycolatopsis sp. DG1A-15b]|uniref:M43 family zinc metalloprotease n=1 Tax=Amycolatopsis sp. DG1A-15b TaxID=3052846 RepID=UPI00255BEBD3|nr:M43 family zinc metalloprotease [Amycolatopsis sp. DG1A-15b]WIX92778.1 M43 family zinc metalloprotease [Amycolatopsis sp. DG1A-15b]
MSRSWRTTARRAGLAAVLAVVLGTGLTTGVAGAAPGQGKPSAPANINPAKRPVLDPAKIKREQAPPLSKAEMRAQAYDWVAEDGDSRVACFTADGKLSGVAELDRADSGPLAAAKSTQLCARAWPKSKPALDVPQVRPQDHSLGHHWAHNGLAHSQIYFVDHTGAKWPVTTATYKWNEAQGVDSYYESSCPGSWLHCVNVSEYNANDGIYGVTYFPNGWDSAGHNYEGVYVQLNNFTVTTSTQARKSTQHELGHVLGLAHRFDNSSCMTQGEAPPINSLPDAHDFDELYQIYNHGN